MMRAGLVALLAAAAAWIAPASAIVPPRDCGMIKVSGHRYNVKADQLACKSARRYARTYLTSSKHPRHYSCHRYRGSALVFRCVNSRANPDKTFFAIKR
jgi:hypothetical protein